MNGFVRVVAIILYGHTAGSLLLNNGMSIKQIAEYLGHEKVSTTLDIYTHIDFEGKRATAQAMGNIFRNP